ncbi:MAG: histidine phosphatase family protein [Wenzhouxiangellaceae bacterium]
MTSSPVRIVLVRHAQGSLGTDDYDRLSGLGHRQAQLLGAQLARDYGPSRVVHGNLRRHRQTVGHLSALDGCAVDPDLDEYHVTELLLAASRQPLPSGSDLALDDAMADPVAWLPQFLEFFPAVLEAWQTGGLECARNGRWQEFSDRVARAGQRLFELAARSPQHAVVGVSSAGVISAMTAILLKRDLAWQRQFNVRMYNSSVTELIHEPAHGWRLARANCIAHLPTDDLRSLA